MPVEELRTLLIYDIVDDRIRTKIATACLDFGLTRVQYSAFVGRLNRNKREELFLRLRTLLGDEAGKLLLQPVCDKDVAQVLLHEAEAPEDEAAAAGGAERTA
jgi:CRISPR-associated protein Cas2